MAILAVAVAGYAIGGALAYGTAYYAIGTAIGWAIGSYIGSRLFAPDGIDTEGPRLEDLSVQTSAYGAAIPEIFGSYRVAGNVIWSTGLVEHSSTSSTGGGKGGGGGGGGSETKYYYYVSFAVGLCEGPITGTGRIWLDGKLLVDQRHDLGLGYINVSLAAATATYYTVYSGSTIQTPDPTMEAWLGAGNVPAYRGLAYIVFQNLPLKDYGNHVPNVSVEVYKSGTPKSDLYEIPIEASNLYGVRITQDWNILTCDTTTKKFYYYSKISDSLLYSFNFPIYDGEDYGASPYTLGGWTTHNGHLITIWNTSNASKKIRVLYHSGINASIYYVKELTSYPVWDSSPDTMVIQAVLIHNDQVIIAESSRNEIVFFNDWDWPTYSSVIIPDLAPTLSSLEPHNIVFNYTTGNMWLDNGGSYISEYAGISGTILNNYSSWDGNTIITGFTGYGTGWTVLFQANDILKVYEGNFTASTINYTSYGSFDYPFLDTIVEKFCTDAGLEENQIDASNLSTTRVMGYARTNISAARKCIEPLQQAFLFDITEVNKTIKFVLRGGASEVTIPLTELSAHEGSEQPDKLQYKFANENELLTAVIVRFLHIGRQYEQSAQIHEIYFPQTKNYADIGLPMVLNNTLSLQAAQKLLISSRVANINYEFSTTSKYLYLSPSDIITIDSKRMRINQMDFSGTLLRFTAISEYDASAYSSALTTAENEFDLVLPPDTGTSNIIFLDLPVFYEIDNNSGFYAAAHGTSISWPGCIVYYSSDGGGVWSQITAIIYEATVGSTLNQLSLASEAVWDRGNTLNIQLYGGTLSSATEINVLNGSNVAIVGTHGRWEVIQFADATLNGDGTYTIQTLLRGRFGTEWAISLHQTNDIFIILDSNTIVRIPLGEYEINVERTYKAITVGSLTQDAENIDFTNTAMGLKPYAVCHVRGVRDVSNNLTITWQRRDRLYGLTEWGDYAIGSRSSDPGNYEIDIVGASPDRTITISDETASYTAAQQTTDGLTPGDPVNIQIYEMSEIAGRGLVKDITI